MTVSDLCKKTSKLSFLPEVTRLGMVNLKLNTLIFKLNPTEWSLVGSYLKHVEVLRTPVACATYESGIQTLRYLAKREQPAAVCAGNTHIVSLARHDASFGKVMRGFDLLLPDGMPLIWAMNWNGAALQDRVYGPYFMREALRQLPRPWKHFFFGGSESCLSELTLEVLKLQPDLDIVGAYSPPYRSWTEEEEREFARIIQEKSPDFIWVALGGERQERWISRNLHRHQHGVFLAIGDAFELLAGRRPFAPAWMQKLGLTWLYRLSQEPRRLWLRYLQFNSFFLYYVLLDWLTERFQMVRRCDVSKPSVAFIGSRGVPARYSGFETVVEQLGARLAERGYPVTVYNRDAYYKTLRREWKGMRIVWLPTIPSKSLDTIVHTSLSLLHALFCRYDMIYLCGVGNAPLGRLIKWFSRSRLIINVDGADFRRKKWGPLARSWLRTSEKQAVKLADAIIADNTEVVKRYEQSYGRTPNYLSYGANKVDGRNQESEVRIQELSELKTWGLERGGYFLFVSRLTPENEADLVIQAYALFREKAGNGRSEILNQEPLGLPRLVIVGSAGYEVDYYRKLQEMMVEGVLFTGARFGEAYAELSQNALAFLMPATIEATRLVLLDQLGFGSIILYRDCPATREVMGDAGIAFDGENPALALAEKMWLIWQHPEKRDLWKQAAFRRAEEKFDWELVTDSYEKLFGSFL
jgi:N-acetylglucosaminyldiphosphoundecaprenol N-acetyl-beta-D-mannosaminyltransferase